MLSSLPKLADRVFIMGFFLPSLLFALAILGLFSDQPWACNLLANIGSGKESFKDLAYILIAVWVLAVLLLVLNYPFYRFLEGYLWPLSSCSWLKSRQKNKCKNLDEQIKKLYERWASEQDKFPAEDQEQLNSLKQERNERFPDSEYILPTTFGNAIHAFETYPNKLYGADGVSMWLRLTAVISKDYLNIIQDGRNQVDFLVNCCYLAASVSILASMRILVSAFNILFVGRFDFSKFFCSDWGNILWAIISMTLAYAFYYWAESCIPRWGELVKSAFDCYLPALAKKLGYVLPETGDDRKKFWESFSQMAVLHEGSPGQIFFNPKDWTQVSAPPDN